MLCLVGTDVDPGRSFLCQEAAAGRSLGFRGGDKEGGISSPTQRCPEDQFRNSSDACPGISAQEPAVLSDGRQGAPLHPEPEATGRCRLSNPAGRCSSPRASQGSTCRSEVPPPTPPPGFWFPDRPSESHLPLMEFAFNAAGF